jgi:hypothetical protein
MATLTLYIPTYNRSIRLKKCLIDLVTLIQTEKLNSSIDILVGDNCSTDSTSDVLRDLKVIAEELGITLNYFKNSINLDLMKIFEKDISSLKANM